MGDVSRRVAAVGLAVFGVVALALSSPVAAATSTSEPMSTDTTEPTDATTPDTTEPDDTTPDTTEPDGTTPGDPLVGAGDPDDELNLALAVIAVVGFGALLAMASWWMVRRSGPDSQPMPPPDAHPPSDLI